MMTELWNLSDHLVEEEEGGEVEDVVLVEEEVTVDLHHTMKLNKMEEIMETMLLLLHSTMSMMMEVWSLSGHLVEEEEAAGEEDDVAVVVEEEVSMLLNHTMKLNNMEETMNTILNRSMDMMLLLRAVEVAVEGVVVEEEEAVVGSTDQMDHLFRQLLKVTGVVE